jgi:hypothetical protein
MTDDIKRPASEQTRASESEPETIDAPETRASGAGDPAADGGTVEVAVETGTEVHAPAGAAVERVDEAEQVAPQDEDAPASVTETVEEIATEPETGEAEPAEEMTVAEVEETPVVGAGEETVSEPGVDVPFGDQDSDTFIWHPDHRGKTVDQVRSALAQEIASDQRQHRLAMDGAEESEQDALASVVSLERKWGPYDFDWAEQEPEALADRITEFERERERRREMVSWSDYRNAEVDRDEALAPGERPAELSTGVKALALTLVVLLIVVILLAVWAL